eukprot:7098626-Lingulodinium_polyedra.AAC.1
MPDRPSTSVAAQATSRSTGARAKKSVPSPAARPPTRRNPSTRPPLKNLSRAQRGAAVRALR